MAEGKLYKKLKHTMRSAGIQIMLQRIESGGTGEGIPDLFFRSLNQDGWIELKEIHWPKRGNTRIKIPFQKGQLPWITRYRSLGGHVFLFVLCNKDFYLFSKHNIKEEYKQIEFLEKTSYRSQLKYLNAEVFLKYLED